MTTSIINNPFGSTLVSALKRSIEQGQRQGLDVEEWLDTTGLASFSGQVAVGELEETNRVPEEDVSDTTIGLDCSESTAAGQLDEQCQSNAQNSAQHETRPTPPIGLVSGRQHAAGMDLGGSCPDKGRESRAGHRQR